MQSMVTEAICVLLRERGREKEREVNVLSMVEANGKRNENGGVFMEWPRVWGSNLVVAESEGSEFYLFYFLIMGQIITAYLMFSLSLSLSYLFSVVKTSFCFFKAKLSTR